MNLFSNRSSPLSDASVGSRSRVCSTWRWNYERKEREMANKSRTTTLPRYANDTSCILCILRARRESSSRHAGVILLFTGFRTTHLLDAIAGNKTLSPLSTFIYIQRPSDGASERQFAIFARRYRSTSNEKYSRVNVSE